MANIAVKVFDATALSGTATVKSLVTTRGTMSSAHYVIKATGTPTSTIKLEVNNKPLQDYDRDVAAAGSEAANTTDWVDQDLSPTATIALAGAAVNNTVSFRMRGVRYRLSATNASSTGTLNAWVTLG